MKNRRVIFILIVLLALTAIITEEFYPSGTFPLSMSSTTAKHDYWKITQTPKPKPLFMGGVEAPKIAPVPAHDTPDTTPVIGFDSESGPSPTRFSATVNSAEISDLGDVYFANGVPEQLTLNDGTPVTITATFAPQGLSLQITLPNRAGVQMNVITGGLPDKNIAIGGMGGIPRLKFTPHED